MHSLQRSPLLGSIFEILSTNPSVESKKPRSQGTEARFSGFLAEEKALEAYCTQNSTRARKGECSTAESVAHNADECTLDATAYGHWNAHNPSADHGTGESATAATSSASNGSEAKGSKASSDDAIDRSTEFSGPPGRTIAEAIGQKTGDGTTGRASHNPAS